MQLAIYSNSAQWTLKRIAQITPNTAKIWLGFRISAHTTSHLIQSATRTDLQQECDRCFAVV